MTKFRIKAEVEFTVEGGPKDALVAEAIAREALTKVDLPEGEFKIYAVVPEAATST